MERGLLGPASKQSPNVAAGARIRRLLRLHSDQEEPVFFAGCKLRELLVEHRQEKRQGVASHRLRASLRSTDRERQPQCSCQTVQDAARKGKEDENKGCPPAALLAAPIGRGSAPSDPPGTSPSADDLPVLPPFFARDLCTFHHPVPRDYEQRQLPQSVAVGVVEARILARLGRASDHGTSRN